MGDGLGVGEDPQPASVPLTPRMLRLEVLMVLAVGLGPSIIAEVVLLARYLIGGRYAVVSIARLPGHPWADSLLQIAIAIGAGLVLLLVAYVLMRSGESFRDIGLTRDRLGANLVMAVGLTLLLFLCAGIVVASMRALGVHSISTRNRLLERWPYEPAVLVESIRTALVEEVIVCGYLLHRLRQLGWSDRKALTASMVVRSSYHVYGGVPLVAFTIVFGFVMGRFYQRSRRLTAIVATHALYDATLFTIAIADNVHRFH